MKRLCFILFFFSLQAWPWSEMGHEVIAQIAWNNLSPEAKLKAQKLLDISSSFHYENRDFINASKWADIIKFYDNSLDHYHYFDLPYVIEPLKKRDPPAGDNIYTAVCKIVSNFKNESEFTKAWQLPLLIHLIGDYHQPLHTISRFTSRHPGGDLGGTKFKIQLDQQIVSLHLFWDLGLGLLGSFDGLYFPSKVQDPKSFETAFKWSKSYPKTYFKGQIDNLKFKNWLNTSHNYARKYAYQTKELEKPSKSYIQRGQEIIRKQVVLAGLRLAFLLEKLLTSTAPLKTDCSVS